MDRQLDLVIDADGTARWKDLDEAVFAVGTPFLPLDDLIAARRTGAAILADVETFIGPHRRWIDFRPPDDWTVPELPPEWADGPNGAGA